MKKLFALLFCCAVLLSGCSNASTSDNKFSPENNQSVENETNTEQESVIAENNEENNDSEPEQGSYEWFIGLFIENVMENTAESNSNLSSALEMIENYFPTLYNVDIKTFDLENADSDWFYEAGTSFAYLYHYYGVNTIGHHLGECGLDALYSIFQKDESAFDKNKDLLKSAGDDAGLTLQTAIIVGKVEAGQYKVGVDIAAGEYVVFSTDGSGYFSVCSDANGDDIICNSIFTYNAYITIRDGEYLELSCCYAIPLLSNDIEINTDGPGMFKVGVDIPAGEYKLQADRDTGYYCIYPSSRQEDIVANDIFDGQAYVSVYDGQYLDLSECRIQK
ncbi:MAG: hypothetical protein E7426_08365 [Ruminococcaceae bacterium]|nr:hypothetical protein [Oscillospiraceae bacterium]